MYNLDRTDYLILEILKRNGRISYSDIADEVHLSRVAVRDRIVNMQDKNVIRGFTVQINSVAYNKNVAVFFDVEVDPHLLEDVAQRLTALDDIAIVSQHTGTSGLHVHAYLDSVENLSDFINSTLYSIDGVRNIHSHILIKNYKTNAFIC